MSRFSILENGLKIAWIYSRTDQIFHFDFACWHQLVAACLGSPVQCSVSPRCSKSYPFSHSRLSPLQFAKSPSFGLPCFSPHPFSKTKYCTIPLISSGYNITLYANDWWLWSGQSECPNCFRFVLPPMVQQWNFHRDLSRLKKVADKSPMFVFTYGNPEVKWQRNAVFKMPRLHRIQNFFTKITSGGSRVGLQSHLLDVTVLPGVWSYGWTPALDRLPDQAGVRADVCRRSSRLGGLGRGGASATSSGAIYIGFGGKQGYFFF